MLLLAAALKGGSAVARASGQTRRSRLTAVLAICFLTGLACGSPTVNPATTAPAALGGTLTLRMSGDWSSLDPHPLTVTTTTTGSNQIMHAVYDRLVMIDQGKIIPYLATSWQQTPTSITFKIRNDATCSDGTKVTPSLVVDNWKHVFDPSKPSAWASNYVGKGPYSFSSDDAAGTATFTLTEPRGDELYAFAGETVGAIVCPAGLNDLASLESTPSGSGPYSIVSATHGDQVVLKARPDWKWGPNGTTSISPGFPQQLTLKIVTNETTAANLLLTGGLDVSTVKGPDVVRLRTQQGLTSQKYLPYTADLIQFNHDPARVTSDLAVRQAFAMVIGPVVWNQLVANGDGVPTTSVVTPNAPCFDPDTSKLMPTTDPDRARAILAADGYVADPSGKLSKDGNPLAIKILGYAFHGPGLEYVLSQFTNIGVSATVAQYDQSTTQLTYRAGDWDVFGANFSLPTPGPLQIFQYLSGPNPPAGVNFSRIVDPELESDIAATKQSTGDQQCRAWAKVQERFLDQMHALPLPGQVTTVFGRPGFAFSATSGNDLEVYALRAPPK
jgi:peptide/nickel transport system substrate-binding protein